MWRGNVVAIGREDDDGVADAAQIDGAAVANANFALLQLITDEEIFDNGNHLFPAEPIITAPPAFEFEKAPAFAIDMRKETAVLLPYGLSWLQRLKILGEPCPVKPAIAKISQKARRPHAAGQSPGDAHRIYAGLPGPIR